MSQLNNSTLAFKDSDLSPEFVIDRLKAEVTPERWQKIQKVVSNRNPLMSVVLEGIYDRGNASAVMRSAEAFGFYNLHMIELNEKFKESKRVTQGADKWLRIHKWDTTEACIKTLKDQGHKIYVTHLDGGIPIEEADFSQPVALCFGNELKGASQNLTELADQKVFIPMQGFVQSFNISVAAALSFYHVHQRTQPVPPLKPEEQRFLQALYLMRTIKKPETYLS